MDSRLPLLYYLQGQACGNDKKGEITTPAYYLQGQAPQGQAYRSSQ